MGYLQHIMVFVGGAISTMIWVYPIGEALMYALGRHRFLNSAAVGCSNVAVGGGLACWLFYGMIARLHGPWLALLTFPSVGIIATLLATGYLWIEGRGDRRQEFDIRDDRIVRLKDNAVLAPEWIRTRTVLYQTGPAGGFDTYSLVLYGADGVLAENRYLDERLLRRELHRALQISKCHACELVLFWRETPTRWFYVKVSRRWGAILCRPLEALPPESREWWTHWLLPEFPDDGYSSVDIDVVRAHLEALFTAYARTIDRDERLVHNRRELEALLTRARGAIELTTLTRFTTMCQDGAVDYKREDDLSLVVIRPRDGDQPSDSSVLLRAGAPQMHDETLLQSSEAPAEHKPEEPLRASDP